MMRRKRESKNPNGRFSTLAGMFTKEVEELHKTSIGNKDSVFEKVDDVPFGFKRYGKILIEI